MQLNNVTFEMLTNIHKIHNIDFSFKVKLFPLCRRKFACSNNTSFPQVAKERRPRKRS